MYFFIILFRAPNGSPYRARIGAVPRSKASLGALKHAPTGAQKHALGSLKGAPLGAQIGAPTGAQKHAPGSQKDAPIGA